MTEPKLLTRDQFREAVQERDGHKCVRCGRKADGHIRLDSHHIMERRLWTDISQFGGYFVENGATLCDTGYEKINGEWSCHLQAGMTLISPDEVRKMAGIKQVLLPEHLYSDRIFTVWGDTVLSNGRRMRGELFADESVQKMLALGGVVGLYDKYVPYPRTYHLPFSPKVLSGEIGDDRSMISSGHLDGQRVIVTAKMDGGQTTLYDDYMHLRTTDFKSDPTVHRLQALHSKIKYHLGNYRLNVENLVGSHVTGIQYRNLKSFFYAFMLWNNDTNVCLPWDETVEFVSILDDIIKNELGESMGLELPKVLYDGPFSQKAIESLYTPMLDGDELEGLVVRYADKFAYRDFRVCVGKYVRAEHVVRHDQKYLANELATV